MAYREETVFAHELMSSPDGPSPSPQYSVQVRAMSTNSYDSKEPLVNPKKDKCTCCPYGYHIDLDFLNFCENMTNGGTLRQLKQIKRNKKNLRKSMEFYLQQQEAAGEQGLGAPQPDIVHSTDASRILNIVEYESSATNKILDEIDSSVNATITSIDGMIDSTSTSSSSLHRITKQLSYDSDDNYDATSKFNTFPRKRAPQPEETSVSFSGLGRTDSTSSISSLDTVSSEQGYQGYPMSKSMQDYATNTTNYSSHSHSSTTTRNTTVTSTELAATMATYFPHGYQDASSPSYQALSPDIQGSTTISKASLEAIRESMAVSLARMRELEEQVKTLPVLQVRISVLKEEKRLLQLQLRAKNNRLNQGSVGGGNTVTSTVDSSVSSSSQQQSTQEQRTTITKTSSVQEATNTKEQQLHLAQQQLLLMSQQQEQITHLYLQKQKQKQQQQQQDQVHRTVKTVAVIKKPTLTSTGVGDHSVFKPYDLQPNIASAYFSKESHHTHSKIHTFEKETIVLKQFNEKLPKAPVAHKSTAVTEVTLQAPVPTVQETTVKEVTLQAPVSTVQEMTVKEVSLPAPVSTVQEVSVQNVSIQAPVSIVQETMVKEVSLEAPVSTVKEVTVQGPVSTEEMTLQTSASSVQEISLQAPKPAPRAPKPMSRTIGVGDGNVFETSDSGLHIHEKELRTVIIGQAEAPVAKRNVGVECRVATRDVGISYVCDEEKPAMRTVAVGTDGSDLSVMWNMEFKSEEIRMAIRQVLSRNVRSVGVNCHMRPMGRDVGVQYNWTKPMNLRTIGCGDYKVDDVPAVPKPPVKTASASCECKPVVSHKSSLTDKEWTVEQGTLTESCDVEHVFTNTERVQMLNTGTITDTKKFKSDQCQTDLKIFMALDQVRNSSCNTDIAHHRTIGVNTQRKPLSSSNFDMDIFSVEEKSEYKTSSKVETYSERHTSHHSSNVVQSQQTRTLNGRQVTPERSSVKEWNSSVDLNYQPASYKHSRTSGSRSVTSSMETLNSSRNLDGGQGHITSSTSHENLYNVSKKAPQYYTEGSTFTTRTSGGSNTSTINVTAKDSSLGRGLSLDSGQGSITSSNSRDSLGSELEKSSQIYTEGGGSNSGSIEFVALQETDEGSDSGDEYASTEETTSGTTVTVTSGNIEKAASGSSQSRGRSQRAGRSPSLTKSDGSGSGSDLDMERSQVLRQMAESAQKSMKGFSGKSGSSMGGKSTVTTTTKTVVSKSGQDISPTELKFTSGRSSNGNRGQMMQGSQSESQSVVAQVCDSEVEFPQEYTVCSQTVSVSRGSLPAEQLSNKTASMSVSVGADSQVSESVDVNKNSVEFVPGTNRKTEMVTDLDAPDSSVTEMRIGTGEENVSSSSTVSLQSSSESRHRSTKNINIGDAGGRKDATWVTVSVLPGNTSETSEGMTIQDADFGSSGNVSSRITSSSSAKTSSKEDDRSGSTYHRSTAVTMESAMGPIVSTTEFVEYEPESPESSGNDQRKVTKVYSKRAVVSSDLAPEAGGASETVTTVTSSSTTNAGMEDTVSSSEGEALSPQAQTLRDELNSLAQDLIVSKRNSAGSSEGSSEEFSEQHVTGEDGESSYSFSVQQSITSSSSTGTLELGHDDPGNAGGVSFENRHAMSYGNLNNETNYQELKSCMKRSKSEPGAKKEISFADSVQGGFPKKTSETSSSDDESSDSDSSDSDSGSSTSSFEEGSYDGRQGNIIYSCKDDEAIAQGIPGAKMFDQNIRETYELTEDMQLACQVLNMYLEDSTQVQSKQLNTSLNIIQQEWFRVSSHKLSNAYQVEDYLSCFNEIDKKLLKHIVNMFDANGNCTIHYAVSHSNFEIVNLLLDTGVCDVDKKNKAGYSAIMLASLAYVQTEDHQDVVRRLFSLGNVNARASEAGQTALMLCVSHGRDDMVKMLLQAGADVNCQDEDGSTALMCACEHGHTDIVKTLLGHPGCNATLTDNDGQNALAIAMETDHKDIGVLLYAHMNFIKQPVSSGLQWKRRTSEGSTSPSSAPSTPQ